VTEGDSAARKPMRVFVTGGAGFVGGAVVRRLRARGDEVVAAVRDPDRARGVAKLGCRVVKCDLSSSAELVSLMTGVDAVIHGAGSYRIGIASSERAGMEDSNVGATARVLDAATKVGAARIVYVSTVNVFGDTHGAIVDETYRRDPAGGFLSWYDETKSRAHLVALERIADGAPIVIGMPGQVYGPGDHSAVGGQLSGAFRGRLPYVALGQVGLAFVHVDDLADGLVSLLDRGRTGESYVLAGEPGRMIDALELAARLGGHRLPPVRVPTGALRLMAPLSGLLGGRFGVPANLAEVIAAGDGVTYWASHDKASQDLGFAPRALENGFRSTYLPAAAGNGGA
jgi:dihydroflavonol-4-reductase